MCLSLSEVMSEISTAVRTSVAYLRATPSPNRTHPNADAAEGGLTTCNRLSVDLDIFLMNITS
jgi:hypothetical protein